MAVAKLGSFTTVSAAELASATSAVNALSDARLGSAGIGKHTGAEVLVRTGDVCIMYIALGPNPTDKWARVDGGAVVTPA